MHDCIFFFRKANSLQMHNIFSAAELKMSSSSLLAAAVLVTRCLFFLGGMDPYTAACSLLRLRLTTRDSTTHNSQHAPGRQPHPSISTAQAALPTL